MKRLCAIFALSVLGATTGALAQTYSQQSPTSPPPASQQEQTSPSKADKQALMKDCLSKMQAANPNADQKDIKAYCDKRAKEYPSSEKDSSSPK